MALKEKLIIKGCKVVPHVAIHATKEGRAIEVQMCLEVYDDAVKPYKVIASSNSRMTILPDQPTPKLVQRYLDLSKHDYVEPVEDDEEPVTEIAPLSVYQRILLKMKSVLNG